VKKQHALGWGEWVKKKRYRGRGGSNSSGKVHRKLERKERERNAILWWGKRLKPSTRRQAKPPHLPPGLMSQTEKRKRVQLRALGGLAGVLFEQM